MSDVYGWVRMCKGDDGVGEGKLVHTQQRFVSAYKTYINAIHMGE